MAVTIQQLVHKHLDLKTLYLEKMVDLSGVIPGTYGRLHAFGYVSVKP